MIDECITWKDHIRTVENMQKIAKNIGLLHRAKQLLNTSSLKRIYSSYIDLNYANFAWARKQKSKLKMISIKPEHAVRILFNDRLCHSRPLLKTLNG